MIRKRIITAGITAMVAAWLGLGWVNLVYAAPDPAPAPATSTTTAPTADPSSPGAALPGNTNSSVSDNIQPTCSGGGLGWIACPLINLGIETIQKVSTIIVEMLQVRPLVQDNSLYQAWLSFRNLADVAFILIFMVLIFSTTLSINVSAYQLKSLLPKLIIAAVLVQISFFLTTIAIDIGNVLGAGVSSIFAGLGGSQNVVAGTHQGAALEIAVASITAIAAGFILTWPFVLLMLLALFIAVAGVFVTLAARQLIITVLIITSPLAFAAWVLPGTQPYFKIWYKNLVRIILLYPLIVILLSSGAVLARAAQDTDSAHGINVILASIIPIIAFFSIPATFKWAGGIMDWASSNYILKWSRSASTGIRRSQLAEDMKATRREKGFERQRDIPNKFLGIGGTFGQTVGTARRYKNRLQAGQIGIGQPSRRRLVRGYDDAIEAQRKDWGSYFDDQQWGNDDLWKLASTPVGGSYVWTDANGEEHVFKNPSKAMRIAAVARWTAAGGNLETSKMMNEIFDPKGGKNGRGDYRAAFGLSKHEVIDMWFRGLGAGGAMAATISAVPPVNPGKMNSVWDTMTASQLAGIHGSATPFLYERMMADIEPTNEEEQLGKDAAMLKKERVERMIEDLAQIARSRELSGRADQVLLKRFHDAVIDDGSEDMDPITKEISQTYDAEFAALAEQITIHIDKDTPLSGKDFLEKYITPLGKIGVSATQDDQDDAAGQG